METDFMEVVNSTATLITAIGALLAGLAALIKSIPSKFWRSLIERLKQKKTNYTKQEEKSMNTVKKGLALIGILLILVSVCIFSVRSVLAQEVPLNQQLTSEAWKFYEKGEYEKAIAKAEECIEMFGGQAEIEQEALTESSEPIPDLTPETKAEKDEIFARGLLNDVATCYFIIGQSYEKLGTKAEAIEAYEEANKFIHAMAWDVEGGFFWSVSNASVGRLRQLKK